VVVKGFDHNKLANRNHDYLPQWWSPNNKQQTTYD
jgi:hypothetical protein